MLRPLFALTLVVAGLGATWMACVGDDPASNDGPTMGDYKGPCFADKTCKTGLVCTQGLCLQPGEAPPDGAAPTDEAGGGPNDGGAGADAADGRADSDASACGPIATRAGAEVSCPDTPDGSCPNMECCLEGTSAFCGTPSACSSANGKLFQCDDTDSCFGKACCATGTVEDAGTSCGLSIHVTSSTCPGTSDCPNAVELCNRDLDCTPPMHCVPANVFSEAEGGVERAVWKICH